MARLIHPVNCGPAPGRLALGARFLLLAALVAVSGTSWADYRLFDDLADEMLGLIHGQDGWTSLGGENAVVIDPADPLNQCLYVPASSSILRKALAVEALSCPDGSSRMLFLRLRVASKQTFSLGLSALTSPNEYSDFACELNMANSTPNLDLRIWDDDGGNYEVLGQLSADTWYNIWVRVDTAGNYSELWLHAKPGASGSSADRLSAENGDQTFDFRSGDASELRTFYVKTSSGGSGFGPIYLDDIYLETTDTFSLLNPVGALLGDLNCDGQLDAFDIDPFVLALTDAEAYALAYPHCDWTRADISADGKIDAFDIDPFVALLIGG